MSGHPSSAKALYLATHNDHKVEELQALLGPGWRVKSAKELEREMGTAIGWNETGETFEENARIKAAALARVTSAAILADDSGLMVDALGGLPGVHSSRFANSPEGTPRAVLDQNNLEKLLHEMRNVPRGQRNARFICCLFFLPARTSDSNQPISSVIKHEQTFIGSCEGEIAETPEGTGGFGYDPIFLVRSKEKSAPTSLGAMTPEEKNQISHRAAAVAKLKEYLNNFK